MRKAFNHMYKYGSIGVLLTLYILLLPVQFRTGFALRVAPSDLILLLLVFIAFLQFKVKRYIFTFWHFAILLLFLFSSLKVLLEIGEIPRYVVLQKDLGLLVLFALYYIICAFLTDRERVRWILQTFIISISFHTALAIILFLFTQLSGIQFFWMNAFSGRLSGMLIDPNAYGGLLVVTFAIHITTFHSSKPLLSRNFSYLILFILSAGIILTFSRSAWVALALVLLFQTFQNPFQLIRTAIFSTVSLFVILLALGRDYLTEVLNMATRSSQIDSRFVIIEKGLDLFYDAPLFGVGIGVIFQKFNIIIHNTPVWILVEFGLLGLVVFAGLMFSFYLKGFYAYRLASKENKPLIFGLLLGFSAMLGLSLGIEALYQRHWWILMSLLQATYMIEMKNSTRKGT
jgi:putative inorganic carbon (hco3(-)) transporter